MNHLSDIRIKDAAPHIFRRPFLFVESNTQMLQIATFFVIGPQIYVDGIIVIDEVQKRQVELAVNILFLAFYILVIQTVSKKKHHK